MATAATTTAPKKTLPPPVAHPGFRVTAHEAVGEYNAVATVYTHEATGGQVLSVAAPDDEVKVFGALFKTPVGDSRGTPHILEHSVLCGSRKYPVKEPFVQLLKSSLKTYLNALTFSDRTLYPVASPNTTDFYNLVDVYCDAVFHPRLPPWVLQQEGWHYEVAPSAAGAPAAASTTPKLSYKGVVFNEMKGVYSSADSVRAYVGEAALFPDTAYAHSSGGDPLAIPGLTYDAFRDFHRRYYHPSNARLYWWGNDDPAKRLAISASYFESAAAAMGPPLPPKPADLPWDAALGANVVGLQRRWSAPRRISAPYPAAREAGHGDGGGGGHGDAPAPAAAETPTPSAAVAAAAATWPAATGGFSNTAPVGGVGDKHDVTLHWVLQDHPGDMDAVTRLGVGVLNALLLGTPSSVLVKALTDSALGSSVIGGGYDDSTLQATFSVGLKGVAGHAIGAVEDVVATTLAGVAADGFPAAAVEAALNTLEFRLREFAAAGDTGRGLSLLFGVAGAWTYGRDPIAEMRYEAPLAALKATLATQPRYFADLAARLLLTNSHRLTVHMYPDAEYGARREAAEAAAAAAAAAAMSPADVAGVAAAAAELARVQATPDAPEDVAKVPTLRVSDLPTATAVIPRVVEVAAPGRTGGHAATLLLHEQPTAGVAYASLYFDLSPVPLRLLPLVPLLEWALTNCGTTATEEVALSHALGSHTGGVGAGTSVLDVPGDAAAAAPYLVVSGKALGSKTGKLADLMGEMLATARLDRRDRILHFLRSSIADMESAVVSSGHAVASSLLAAQYTKGGWVSEVLGGWTHLQAMRMLLAALETGGAPAFDALVADLQDLRAIVFHDGNALLSLTGDATVLPSLRADMERLLAGLPGDAAAAAATGALSAHAHGHAHGHGLPTRVFASRLARLASGWHWPAAPAKSSTSSAQSPAAAAAAAAPPLTSAEAGHRARLPHWPFPHLLASGAGLGGLAPAHIGLAVPTQVNYVAKAARGWALAPTGPRFVPGGAEVVSKLVNTGYLWDRVRVQGGAYGCFAGVGRTTGLLTLASYRDPGLGSTLDVYDGLAAHLEAAARDGAATLPGELAKATIAVIGAIDAPQAPESKAATSTVRFLAGITDADIAARRAAILTASPADVRAFAAAAATLAKEGRTAAVASDAAFADFHATAAHARPMFELSHPLA